MEHVVDLVAALIWPVLLVGLLFAFRKPIQHQLLPRLTGVKAFGVELSFAQRALEEASRDKPAVTERNRTAVVARLQRDAPLLAGARILWVDNEPKRNFHERRLFERVGAQIDPALTTDEALDLTRRHPYDVVISDWARPEGKDAGPDLVRALRDSGVATPVVFYAGHVEGRSRGEAVGLTNRPDELVHFVLDALERTTP